MSSLNKDVLNIIQLKIRISSLKSSLLREKEIVIQNKRGIISYKVRILEQSTL